MDDHALRLSLQARRRGTLLRTYEGAGSEEAQIIALCKTLATITNLVSLPEDMDEGVKLPGYWRVVTSSEGRGLLQQIYAKLLEQRLAAHSVSEVDSHLKDALLCLPESRASRRALSRLRFLDVLNRLYVQDALPSLVLLWAVVQRGGTNGTVLCLKLPRYLEILRDGLTYTGDFPLHEIVQVFEPETDPDIKVRIQVSPYQFEVISDRSDLVLCERRPPSNLWQLTPEDLKHSIALPDRIGIYL